MKINARVFRSLTSEPIEVQEINGKQIEVHFMNDTKYLSEYIPRGRFYIWTSNGNDYRLLVESGFYKKLDYFFSKEVNTIWIEYLEDVGNTDSKSNRNFMFMTLGLTVVVVFLAGAFLDPNYLIWVMIAFFAFSMFLNVMQSRRVRDRVRQKNIAAQDKIREVLTPEGFERLLKDQDDYIKEYFDIEDEEETEVLDENELIDNIEELEELEEVKKTDEGEIE